MSAVIQHAWADVGDVALHYVTAGPDKDIRKGPAVVLLHGWPQTWFMWRDVIPSLARRFRVIAPDLRGLGDSSRPVGGYDKKTLANDIWLLAHTVLGEDQLLVVGHDWGGPVAFALAAQNREAVRGLAIFDAPVPGDGTPSCLRTAGIMGFTGSPIFRRRSPPAARNSISVSSIAIGAADQTPYQPRLSENI